MPAPSDPPDEPVTADVLSSYLGVGPRAIREFVSEGLPKLERGRYPLRAAVAWYCADLRRRLQGKGYGSSMDYQEARRRKLQADAERAELELDQKRGTVLDADDVKTLWRKGFTMIKERMTALALRLATLSYGKPIPEAEQANAREIADALNAAADATRALA